MFIKSYGLFWSAHEIEWNPGQGNKGEFQLLGRRGVHSSKLEMADFMRQQGIYILYGNYGPYYVGLTKKQGLGKRLKQHLTDQHADKWDRFSWFGFCQLLKPDSTGLRPLKALPEVQMSDPMKSIGDVEALLIKAMGTQNVQDMKFAGADEWTQVEYDEVEKYLKRVQGAKG